MNAAELLAAFPGSTPAADPTMWAGIAGQLPPDYAAGLPAGLLDAIDTARRTGWDWGVCTKCGAGRLVPNPPTPKVERPIGNNDGPTCYMIDCTGRQYPLDGPLPHPLAARRPEYPW